MRNSISLFVLLLTLTACDDENYQTPTGLYEGVFYRTSPDGKSEEASVVLTFTAHGFSGESDRVQYPAICTGTFNRAGNLIKFTNACAWTAHFDWTLILSGDFIMKQKGNNLTLTRHHGAGVIDTYELTRQ